MNDKLNLVMPMAGAGSRFTNDGYECPKPLIMLHGKPFFCWAVESILSTVQIASLRFVVLQEHIERFQIDQQIRTWFPEAGILALEQVLPGAVLTCMEGARDLAEDAPVLFNDCDHLFRCSGLQTLAQTAHDERPGGAMLTFRANEPKYSFLECGEDGNAIRTAEKQVISDTAICGAYYFNRKSEFFSYAHRYLSVCQYSEFFMSGVYNEMIADGKRVTGIPTQLHISFGTPEEYELAKLHPWFEDTK